MHNSRVNTHQISSLWLGDLILSKEDMATMLPEFMLFKTKLDDTLGNGV